MEFSKPKVIIDMAEYDHLKAEIEVDPTTDVEKQKQIITMYSLVLGNILASIGAYKYVNSVVNELSQHGFNGAFLDARHTGKFNNEFVITPKPKADERDILSRNIG